MVEKLAAAADEIYEAGKLAKAVEVWETVGNNFTVVMEVSDKVWMLRSTRAPPKVAAWISALGGEYLIHTAMGFPEFLQQSSVYISPLSNFDSCNGNSSYPRRTSSEGTTSSNSR